MENMEENQKVVLLTGASGGLGTAMAQHLADQGYRLALHYLENIPTMEESENVLHFQADLRKPEEIEAMVDAVRGLFGRLDIIINNAGISRNGMSWKLDFEDWDEEELCAFEKIESSRARVDRYELRPTGKALREYKEKAAIEPITTTCGSWGMGNSGVRYFEIHQSNPKKALFIEIGQEAPLFDENTIIVK
jgi:hypothetical protein